MLRTLISRGGASFFSIALLVTMVFIMAHLPPGGPAFSILGVKATAASVAAINKKLGLDIPLWKQYAIWWSHLLQGNLGTSYLLNRPVNQVLWAYFLNTIIFYIIAILVSVVAAILVGLVQGVYYGRWPARVIDLYQMAFYALPSFFVGTVLIMFFAVRLGWLPASGIVDVREISPSIASYAAHLVLPVITVALMTTAGLSRYFGEAVHEELGKEYVRTAMAKGVSFPAVLFKHVLRNALRPLVTILGLSFPYIFTGGVTVETVFDYPGLGWLMWRSALERDYPVLIAIVLIIGVLTVVGNFIADLVNGLLDPRARYE